MTMLTTGTKNSTNHHSGRRAAFRKSAKFASGIHATHTGPTPARFAKRAMQNDMDAQRPRMRRTSATLTVISSTARMRASWRLRNESPDRPHRRPRLVHLHLDGAIRRVLFRALRVVRD